MTVEQLTHQYIFSLRDGHWDELRATFADAVELESPLLGRISGIEDVMAAHQDGLRFPTLSSLTVRRVAYAEDLAFISYEVYLQHRRRATVIDQLSFGAGRIIHILSVVGEWPSA